MKIAIAVVMGFLSGYMLYFVGGLIFLNSQTATQTRTAFAMFALFSGWLLSSFFLLRGARTVSKVLSRGFLLGAAEWLLMVGVGIVRIIAASRSNASFGFLSGGTIAAASLFMAVVCLTCFAVVHFWKREMKPENQER